MSTTRKIPGAVAAALATAAIAAPAAGAMPLRDASEFDAGHAALAMRAAAHQDLRSPDARDAALHPRPAVTASTEVTGQPSPPSFPGYHDPVSAVSKPVGDDDGFPWAIIVLSVAGAGVAAGGAAGVTRSIRVRARRARVAV
jgi:hypothetical protein